MGYRNSDTVAIFEAYGQVSKQDRFEKYKENIMKDPNMSSVDKLKAIDKLEKSLLGTDSSSTATPTTSENDNDQDNSQTYAYDQNAPKKPVQYNDDGTIRIGAGIPDELDDEGDSSYTTTFNVTDTDDADGDEIDPAMDPEEEWRRIEREEPESIKKTVEISRTDPITGEVTSVPYKPGEPYAAGDEEMGAEIQRLKNAGQYNVVKPTYSDNVTPVDPNATMSKDGSYYTYTVQRGDNPIKVISKIGTREKDPSGIRLREYNGVNNSKELMKVGKVIKVPVEISSLL
jgi:hypothetical protein